jgi:hypothetical protein
MPVENPAFGAGTSPLLMSVPVRHYSMLFRPQLWGFFVFDAEHGFAWFWNMKVFGLLLSFFFLFRKVMQGRTALAILGSVAVSYSSLVQWFFSSPAMLPEMLASWALMLLAGWSFFDRAAWWKKTGAVILFAGCAINFVLCCYPPFEIPLIYLALTLFGVFVWERRKGSFHGGFAWLAGTAILALALLWPTFVLCRPTLEIIAQTSYPGARRGSGGTMSIAQLLSGLLNFFDGNRPPPAMFPNTSEASNFSPIWLPVVASVVWRLWKCRGASGEWKATISKSRPLCVALAAFIIFFGCYAVIGLPEWFCRVTALNFCTEKRALLAIGIAGLMLTFLSLRADGLSLVRGWARVIAPVLLASLALIYFLCVRSENAAFLTGGYVVLLLGIATLLSCLYFSAKPLVFGCTFAGALLLNNVLVNPISEGLPILLRSSVTRHISAIHEADPNGAWAAYEESFALAEFIKASGAHVLNGVKTVPDLGLFAQLDPAGTNRTIYNRYALIMLGLPEPGETAPQFLLHHGDSYQASVSPFEPAFRARGLKYVVFPRLLNDQEKGPLKLIDALPENLIWIYKLDG